mgnify:FL=1
MTFKRYYTKLLCGIVGFPLNEPRSIPIWQRYIKKHKIEAKMESFEIKPNSLSKFIRKIRKDDKFLAMAVTMPYKKKIIKFLDKLDNFAEKTSSVNLVVKRKNKLFGYNTDIYGARECFKNKIKKYQNIIIFGLGGTGQAIFNYLHHTYKSKNFYLISNKYRFKSNNVKILKKINKRILNEKALIFNCTPLGSNLKKSFEKKIPINNDLIHEISNKSFVFDIIYSPIQTILLKECKLYGLEGINGLRMNTLQAEKALNIVFNKSK